MTKILVYDLDPQFREELKNALTSLGYEAVLSLDGYGVLPLAEKHKPSAVVLDFKLPEADGFEILKRLRATAFCAATPIIFASSTPKFEIEFVVMDEPGVGYIDKPLDPKQLKATLEAMGVPAVKAAPAPAARPPAADIPPPGAPLTPPVFTGEPDLDGSRDEIIDLD